MSSATDSLVRGGRYASHRVELRKGMSSGLPLELAHLGLGIRAEYRKVVGRVSEVDALMMWGGGIFGLAAAGSFAIIIATSGPGALLVIPGVLLGLALVFTVAHAAVGLQINGVKDTCASLSDILWAKRVQFSVEEETRTTGTHNNYVSHTYYYLVVKYFAPDTVVVQPPTPPVHVEYADYGSITPSAPSAPSATYAPSAPTAPSATYEPSATYAPSASPRFI